MAVFIGVLPIVLALVFIGSITYVLIWGVMRILADPVLRSSATTVHHKDLHIDQTLALTSDDVSLLWDLKSLKPNEFEVYVSDIFRRLGYATKVVGGPNDGGIDIEVAKNGINEYVQCKKFIVQVVTVGQIRDFYGATVDKLKRGSGILVTTNVFTEDAVQFALDRNLILINGEDLVRLVRSIEQKSGPIDYPERELTIPKHCPRCGHDVKIKFGPHGEFAGCTNFPSCRYTKSL